MAAPMKNKRIHKKMSQTKTLEEIKSKLKAFSENRKNSNNLIDIIALSQVKHLTCYTDNTHELGIFLTLSDGLSDSQ